MDWKQRPISITSSVDEELRLRNAYLVTENRILRKQIQGRVQLTASERRALAEIDQRLGKKALEEIATMPSPTPSWLGTVCLRTSSVIVPSPRRLLAVLASIRRLKTW